MLGVINVWDILGLGYQSYISYHSIGSDFPITYLCLHSQALMAMQGIQFTDGLRTATSMKPLV